MVVEKYWKSLFSLSKPCFCKSRKLWVWSEHHDSEHSVAFELLRDPGHVPWRCVVCQQAQWEVGTICWEPRLQWSPTMQHGWVLSETPQIVTCLLWNWFFIIARSEISLLLSPFMRSTLSHEAPRGLTTHNLQIRLEFGVFFFLLKVNLTRWFLSVAPKPLRGLIFFRSPNTNTFSWSK